MNGNGSIAVQAAKVLANANPQHALHLQFEECRIHVMTNALELRQRLRDYYAPWVREPHAADIEITAVEQPPFQTVGNFQPCHRAGGKRGVKEEYLDFKDGRVIRKSRTGMVFLIGRNLNVAVGPCLENAQQIVNFIDNRYMEWCLEQGGELLHAAAVTKGHQGLALAAASGKGKSTLALHLVGRGLDFVSNDRVMLDSRLPGLRIYGLAKQPRVNPGTILNNEHLSGMLSPDRRQALTTMETSALWDLEEKYDVDIRRQFASGKHVLLARLSALIILNWEHAQRHPLLMERVDLREREDLVSVVVKSRGVFRRGPFSGEVSQFERERVVRILDGCPCYEITGGVDFGAASDACLSLFQRRTASCMSC